MAPRDGLYKRGSIWWMRSDPVTGKPASTRCRDLRAAEAVRAGRERTAADPASSRAATAKLGEWCDRLHAMKASQNSASTAAICRQKLAQWLRVFGRDFHLADIGPEVVDRYVGVRRGDGVTDHTIVKEFGELRQVLKLAKRSGCYPGDLAALRPLDLHAGYKPRKRAPDRSELVRLISVLDPPKGAAVAIMAGLGVRLSEAFRLLPTDLLPDGMVHVGGTKTAESKRIIPILSPFAGLLEGALLHLPLQPWPWIHHDLQRACKAAGIPACTPNDLRRSHASILRAAGVDADYVRRLLGHTTRQLVDRVYGQLPPAELRRLAEHDLARGPVCTDATIGATEEGPDDETGGNAAPPRRLELLANGLGNRLGIAGSVEGSSYPRGNRDADRPELTPGRTAGRTGTLQRTAGTWALFYAALAMGVA